MDAGKHQFLVKIRRPFTDFWTLCPNALYKYVVVEEPTLAVIIRPRLFYVNVVPVYVSVLPAVSYVSIKIC